MDDDLAYWAFKVAFEAAKDAEIDELPDGIRQVRLVTLFAIELSMSGIDAWLGLHDARWAPETVDALREIGASRCAEVLTRALSIFPGGMPPRDTDEREDLLYALVIPEDYWQRLTDEWQTVANDEDYDALLSAYVRARAALFRLDEMRPPTPLPPASEPSPEALEAIAAMERAAEKNRRKHSS